MKDIPEIGKNLKNARLKRELSLDKLAQLTNISKAMLGQIERGESSPTLNTLWKLATGLKTSFSALLSGQAAQQDQLVRLHEAQVLEEEGGLMKIYPQFIFDHIRGFEVFRIELAPGCVHHSEPHDAGVEEYVFVAEGELTIQIADKTYTLQPGDALRYFADKQHSYGNFSDKPAAFQHTIYYFG